MTTLALFASKYTVNTFSIYVDILNTQLSLTYPSSPAPMQHSHNMHTHICTPHTHVPSQVHTHGKITLRRLKTMLTRKVLVTTIVALGHFSTGSLQHSGREWGM